MDDQSDPRDSSALHRAAGDGNVKMIEALAREPGALNRPGIADFTPLMTALLYGQDDAAARLVALGADVNKASAVGSTPLMTACLGHSLRLAALLLDNGAAVDYQIKRSGHVGHTALLTAAEVGDAAIVRLLLERGADPTIRNGHGQIALDVAARMGYAEVVAILTSWATRHAEATGWQATAASDSNSGTEQFGPDDVRAFEATLITQPPESRYRARVAGIVNAGQAFMNTLARMAELSAEDSPLRQELVRTRTLWAAWLCGRQLTNRVDEAERRLLALEAVITRVGDKVEDLTAALARAVLALPEDHPRRNKAFALGLLVSHAERCAAADKPADLVLAVMELLRHAYVLPAESQSRGEEIAALIEAADGLIERIDRDELLDLQKVETVTAEGWIRRTDGTQETLDEVQRTARERLRLAAGQYFLAEAIAAREADDTVAEEAAIGHCHTQLKALAKLGADHAEITFIRAALEELAGHDESAAATYQRTFESGGTTELFARRRAGQIRLRLGDARTAVDILSPTFAPLRARYLGAVEAADVASEGVEFTATTTLLAFALALCERWDEALRTLDQLKSLRLRHRYHMRISEEGRRVLAIEAALYSIDRGLDPDAGYMHLDNFIDTVQDRVRRRSLYLEEYRRVRLEVADDLVDSPSVRELSAALLPQEGLLVIGTSSSGTLLALITCGDSVEPAAARVIREIDNTLLHEACREWKRVLMVPDSYKGTTHALALSSLLTALEPLLGGPIRELIEPHEVSRLTIVPHLWLHAVPFWALPSLGNLDVRLAPSAAQWLAARTCREVPARAAIVGDPTLDLPLSLIEARSVERQLLDMQVDTARVTGIDADEIRVAAALDGAGLLHFCGHGRADTLSPSRSALLLHPVEDVATAEPISAALKAVKTWSHSPTEGAYADLPGSRRLYLTGYPEAHAREYFLEQAGHGTLWARYQYDERVAFGQMWRAGHIGTTHQFDTCAIVFLSACEVGSGGLGSIYDGGVDECGGIPGALHLAGVPCFVSSLWPVADELALVYVHLFYKELCVDTDAIDIGAAVSRTGRRVRELRGVTAAAIVRGLLASAPDPMAKLRLEALARRVEREECPFGDPLHWAAFFVTGSSRFAWNRVGSSDHIYTPAASH